MNNWSLKFPVKRNLWSCLFSRSLSLTEAEFGKLLFRWVTGFILSARSHFFLCNKSAFLCLYDLIMRL